MIHPRTLIYIAPSAQELRTPELFELSSFSVSRATSGTDAIKRLADTAVDCIVIDLTIDNPGPVDTVERIRRNYQSLPILLTGDPGGDYELISKALNAGATDYVADPTQLPGAVRQVIESREIDGALDDFSKLGGTVRQIAHRITRASSQDELYRMVYDELMASGLYQYGWIGEFDTTTDTFRIRVPGQGKFTTEELESFVTTGNEAFIEQAVDQRDIAVAEGAISTRAATASSVSDADEARRQFAFAAIPFSDGVTVHGVAIMATTRAHALDESERDRLLQLGEIIGHALRLIHRSPEEFAETLVHELRNPLGVAKAQLEIGRDTGAQDALQEVESALDQLEHTIQNLSVLARLDMLDVTSSQELADTAKKAWETIGPETDSADLTIVDSAPLIADHDLLEYLFSNLFRNSIRHSHDTVTIRVGTRSNGFYVEDNGPGIPVGDREKVFARGYTTTDGLGIGLHIVHRIAQAHGWNVSVSESESGGTRVELTTETTSHS